MNTFSTFLFVLAFSMTTISLEAQAVYLKYDDSCMERYEYKFSNSYNGKGHIVYHIKVNSNENIVLEVGAESLNNINKAPEALKICDEIRFNKQLVDNINSLKTKLYIVKEHGKVFNVSPVNMAAHFTNHSNKLNYSGRGFSFAYDESKHGVGDNLATSAEAAVYFEATVYYNCQKGYLFRKIPAQLNKPYTELFILPEFGIAEEKVGNTPEEAEDHVLNLKKIDNIPLDYYLDAVCKKKNPREYYQFVSTKTESVSGSASTQNGPCPETQTEGTYLVKAGETLYSISRNFGISFSQLKNWNNLPDNILLKPCMKLYVVSPSSIGKSVPSAYSEVVTKEPQAAWTSSNGVHLVQVGETIALLAKKYGYSEERFRSINGLNANEVLRNGEVIKTTDCTCPTETKEATNYNVTEFKPDFAIKSGQPDSYSNIDSSRKRNFHTVKENDTLFSIAKKYNLTVEQLRNLNNLAKVEVIIPYQRLYID